MELSIFILAVLSPFLYATTNHIDNILLKRYFKEGGVGALILISALLSVFALPILVLIDPTVLDVDWTSRFILFGVGLLNAILLWAYLQALNSDEPTVVIIFYQIVPVLGLVLGYLVLGETITTDQLIAMGTIILGAIILTVALDEDGVIVFRLRTAAYMTIASFCWAAESTVFKLVALEENPTRSFFWEHTALVAIGLLIYALVPRYRNSFKSAIRLNSKPILGLNFLNEGFYIAGNYVAAIVVIMIPVSMTLLMNSFQPIFVLLIGLALTILLPKIQVEHVNGRNLWQKLIAIALTGAGTYWLGLW